MFQLPRATCYVTLSDNKPVQQCTWDFNQKKTATTITKLQKQHIYTEESLDTGQNIGL